MMKNVSLLTVGAEFVLIALMSMLSIVALTASDFGSNFINEITVLYAPVGPYIPALLFTVVFLVGLVSIILTNHGSGLFAWFTVLLALPSFLSHGSIDFLACLDIETGMETGLSFGESAGIGIALVAGYVLLDSLRVIKQARRNFIEGRVNTADLATFNNSSHLMPFLFSAGSLVAVALVTWPGRPSPFSRMSRCPSSWWGSSASSCWGWTCTSSEQGDAGGWSDATPGLAVSNTAKR